MPSRQARRQTELFRENNPMGSSGEKRYLDKVPMCRFAKPTEIAEAIAFFMRSTWVITTGQTLFCSMAGPASDRLQFENVGLI